MGKDFKQKIGSKRLDSLIPATDSKRGESQNMVNIQQSTQTEQAEMKVLKPKTTVTTFRVNTEKLAQIKALAYWDRKKIQDVFDEALMLYLEKVGDKNLETAVEAFEKYQKS